MKQTSYQDESGRWWAVLLPEEALAADAPLGVPLGPPSLASLNLPEEVEVRLHNQLFARRLFTLADAKRRRLDIFGALQAAFALDVQRIMQLYVAPQVEAAEAPASRPGVGKDGSAPSSRAARLSRRKEAR